MAFDLKALLAKKRAQMQEVAFPAQAAVDMLLVWDRWTERYEVLEEAELLAEWLSPIDNYRLASAAIPSVLKNWRLVSMSTLLGIDVEQAYHCIKHSTVLKG